VKEEIQFQISCDSSGNPLNGCNIYQLHLPPDIPAGNFWSVLVYDSQDRLIIRTDQPWPSVHSKLTKLLVNEDGSVDVYFGPTSPSGNEKNWIKTIPEKEWNMILRLYNPLEAWFDNTWRPGAIEKII
jgi:hypothetical protein